ncbi:hypothetical protein BOO71_0000403 [Deinococcus marmoris]|uniref:Uncharacterized protein n=1 Tax=Deinococcus marmoris TaxID=249408 RepID=A0A1U7P4M0_9DEIO|nr:hypothetical protein BOO71_0000403 [Deinococcus marmoris]
MALQFVQKGTVVFGGPKGELSSGQAARHAQDFGAPPFKHQFDDSLKCAELMGFLEGGNGERGGG